ncbi:DUF5954 family protein [Streptomyces sp. SID7909]|uniref:DUF5954 family protein n=1 Tax=Streptomyces sp. SID7909 TaxID=2706092 RepID=UPI0013BA3CCB|nr:DUF5954 family protein [Streptomyces sp. SID7909]NEC04838.1 hypothetical protein [Streptomyces sp. SID7909]
MKKHGVPPAARPVLVRIPVEPVEAAIEADAFDAASRNKLAVRGPLFGVAAQSEADGQRWRVIGAITNGCPQQARDELQSKLWFRAKDETETEAERRALLGAVARLETGKPSEVTVLGTRYRVVRAEEYAGLTPDGGVELPRPTDPEPVLPEWTRTTETAAVDDGLVLDPDAPVTPLQAAEMLTMRSFAYKGSRYPGNVLRDSERAVHTHPDVLLLPTSFVVVERTGDERWSVGGGLHATPQDARRALDFSLTWFRPRQAGVIDVTAGPDVDARSVVAEGTHPDLAEMKVLADAADRLRAGRLNEVEVGDTVCRIARSRRLVRWGPDGPESQRPSDVTMVEPMALHPRLDAYGVVHNREEGTRPEDTDAA